MSTAPVGRAIQRGLTFITQAQQPDGSFVSVSSPSLKAFQPAKSYQTTFTPALILTALSALEEARPVRDKLASWLLAQRSPHWSFNYWAQAAPERATLPYPDDLDDTFCALIALHAHEPSLIDQSCLAQVVNLLIATETTPGGPYRTWLTSGQAPPIWQDVDLAVNSNIARFLSRVAEPLPKLTKLMEEAIRSRTFRSPYYPSAYPLVYYLARAYRGPERPLLAAYLAKQRRQGWWGSPLRTALALSSLRELDEPADATEAVTKLLRAQQPDGSWPAEAFCLDPAVQGKPYYSGAAALTTALVLEALASRQTPKPPASKRLAKRSGNIEERVTQTARQELRRLEPPVYRAALSILERIQAGDKRHEIIRLPFLFNQSLGAPLTKHDDCLTQLSLANLFGWMAYTIYDDFLDDEGAPPLLPVATIALRASLEHFRQALPAHQAYHQLVGRTFDTIDEANAWEVRQCRFAVTGHTVAIEKPPNYGKRMRLAERSLGHTLTPLGVLAAKGLELDSPEVTNLHIALQHYLIARQLNDDLHDWEQDLRRGHITYVVACLVRELALPTHTYRFDRLLPKLRRQFWHHTLTNVCQTTLDHLARARLLLAHSTLLAQPNDILNLIGQLEAATQKALHEQSKAKAFLRAYRTTANV